MDRESERYWESCWKDEGETVLRYLDGWIGYGGKEIEILEEHQVRTVCDAACGFGAFMAAFASNGFQVHGFDISPTAVRLAKQGLEKLGLDASNVKVASILNTGYADGAFDAVNAHAVLDHLTVEDARKALGELSRITKEHGLIMISFDTATDEDYTPAHVMAEPGTMLYTDVSRKGMLFHPYEWDEIDTMVKGYEVIHRAQNAKQEKVLILKKP